MTLTQKQIETKVKVEFFSQLFGVDPKWTTAVAMVESSLGTKQVSPTGCLGVFQISYVAMKDLLASMQPVDDDLVDIVCGIAFLRLLLRRWGNLDDATKHFCDPAVRDQYLQQVRTYMQQGV